MNKKLKSSIVAGIFYLSAAAYLYHSYLVSSDRFKLVSAASIAIGSAGVFFLSRRWLVSYSASFISGAIYGFGPLMLGLGRFHWATFVLCGMIPWLFVPCVYWSRKNKAAEALFSIIPFAIIILCFQLAQSIKFFPAPIRSGLAAGDLAGFICPVFAVKKGLMGLGFYHCAMGTLLIGAVMAVKARRTSVFIVMMISVLLAFFGAVFRVSPVIWLSIFAVCGAIVCGEGIQGMLMAGVSDVKWLCGAVLLLVFCGVLAMFFGGRAEEVFAGLGNGYGRIFDFEAKMYLMAAAVTAVIALLVLSGTRAKWFRATMLCAAFAVDIYLSASMIVDMKL